MIPARDVWQAALALIRRYGDNAMLEAAERADQLLDEGDMAGAETWHRILDAIERLQAQKTVEGETVQEGRSAELTRLPPDKGASYLSNSVCLRECAACRGDAARAAGAPCQRIAVTSLIRPVISLVSRLSQPRATPRYRQLQTFCSPPASIPQ